jgi:dephospho-CoA kinase
MRGILRKYVPADERVVLWLRPSLLFILIRPRWMLMAIAAAAGAVWFAAKPLDLPLLASRALWWGVVLFVVVLLWQLVEWLSRLYVLTDRRLICVAGVLNQNVADLPLRNVRNLVVVRGLIERLTGLGTLGAASAGTDSYELVWLLLARPDRVLASVRQQVEAAGVPIKIAETMAKASPTTGSSKRPIVIGLTGGIGAGKSEVAHLLAGHGYVVIDSDKDAKAALDRPEVREELVKWWGTRVLTPGGRIDRRAVASIVFSDPSERAKLEHLVHPLVKADRASLIDRAAREGRPGVIVDAPLLLEAGSDTECDVVVFVDSPREQRLLRVQATRGWDSAEMERREKAQLPLEEKRRRSDEVIVNDSSPEALAGRVAELVKKLETLASRAQ